MMEFVGSPQGLSVVNPLGSHGRLAIALALLKASVAILDVSASNARYAREMAICADVALEYIVGDFQQVARLHQQRCDVAVMELDIGLPPVGTLEHSRAVISAALD